MLHSLIERKQEQELYQEFLKEASPWVLAITGLGGSGKSTLLSHLEKWTPSDFRVVKHNFAAQTGSKRSDSSGQDLLSIDPLTILEGFADQARNQCDPSEYRAFKDTVFESRRQLSDQRMQIIQSVRIGNESVVEGGNFRINIDEIRETVHRVHHQIQELVASAFCRLMDAFTLPGLVIFLDTCEWLNEPTDWEVGLWIINVFIPRVRDCMLQQQKKFYLVTASTTKIELKNILDHEILELKLDQLDEKAVKQYFKNMGMRDAEIRNCIYEMTYGNAACVSIISDLWQNPKEKKPKSLAELLAFRGKFNEHARRKFIDRHILDVRLKAPFDHLVRYGVLLRSFTRPMIKEVFYEQQELQDTNKRSNVYFTQFVNNSYIRELGDYRYALHDLLREVLADAIRRQEPEKWEQYHQRALEYLSNSKSVQEGFLVDRYYHSVACKLTNGGEKDVAYWLKMLQKADTQDESLREMSDAFRDKTFLFTSVALAIREFELGCS